MCELDAFEAHLGNAARVRDVNCEIFINLDVVVRTIAELETHVFIHALYKEEPNDAFR